MNTRLTTEEVNMMRGRPIKESSLAKKIEKGERDFWFAVYQAGNRNCLIYVPRGGVGLGTCFSVESRNKETHAQHSVVPDLNSSMEWFILPKTFNRYIELKLMTS